MTPISDVECQEDFYHKSSRNEDFRQSNKNGDYRLVFKDYSSTKTHQISQTDIIIDVWLTFSTVQIMYLLLKVLLLFMKSLDRKEWCCVEKN